MHVRGVNDSGNWFGRERRTDNRQERRTSPARVDTNPYDLRRDMFYCGEQKYSEALALAPTTGKLELRTDKGAVSSPLTTHGPLRRKVIIGARQ